MRECFAEHVPAKRAESWLQRLADVRDVVAAGRGGTLVLRRFPVYLKWRCQLLRHGRSNRHIVPLHGKSDRLCTQGLKMETR